MFPACSTSVRVQLSRWSQLLPRDRRASAMCPSAHIPMMGDGIDVVKSVAGLMDSPVPHVIPLFTTRCSTAFDRLPLWITSTLTRQKKCHLSFLQFTGHYNRFLSRLKCRGCERVEADIPAHLMRSKSGDMPSSRSNFSATEVIPPRTF
jgi:hypothetical protein